jgi:hypothetical protein
MEILIANNLEVKIKYRFLFWTYTKTYKKVDGVIMRYKDGKYYDIGLSEWLSIEEYFKIYNLTK